MKNELEPKTKWGTGALPEIWAALRREEGEYPLWIFDRRTTRQQRQRSGNPEGCFLAGAWRRCSSVRERCGYLPSSRLASRPPRKQRAHSPFCYRLVGAAVFEVLRSYHPQKLRWQSGLKNAIFERSTECVNIGSCVWIFRGENQPMPVRRRT